MRYYFILVAILYSAFTYSKSNNIETIYLFPGQGSDSNIFNNLHLNKEVKIVNIHYPIPTKNISLKDYSKLFLSVIDTHKTFVLIGVSFGGMICTELDDVLKPEKVMEREALIAENLNKQMKFRAFPRQIYVI
jgi:surfactin synthase thioesterase subunit